VTFGATQTTANIVQRPCSDSSHVTAPFILSFYCYLLLFPTQAAYRLLYRVAQKSRPKPLSRIIIRSY